MALVIPFGKKLRLAEKGMERTNEIGEETFESNSG